MSENEITRADISIGSIVVDGFRLADGSYRMSQQQAAEAIGEPAVYALRFLRSRDSKDALGEDYTDYTPESLPVPTKEGARGESRINALPIEVVVAYWMYRSYKGNRRAFMLSIALMAETLERRFDAAFGVSRSEDDRNQKFSDRLSDRELEALGMMLAQDDDLRRENAELRRILQENGLDPYQLPPGKKEEEG
ncbi:hypothetical protein ACQ4M4_27340 [Leptolyngbya sp. AN02str]|uniref:hypothetical protein n=1 Tax=Leptolyngbya sp. AN02str TaxID=3423363 RepID=UPI003D310907